MDEPFRELTPERVARYEARRRHRPPPSLSTSDLKAILDSPDPRRAVAVRGAASREPNLWRDHITRSLHSKTSAVLDRETDSDPRGWGCHSYPSRAIRTGDFIAFFDFSGKRHTLRLAQVRGKTRTTQPTPDGRWFVAHSTVPRTRTRTLTKSLWAQLVEDGVITSRRNARRGAQLAAGKVAALRKLLR